MSGINIDNLKKELENLEKESKDIYSKSEKINNLITKKKRAFNNKWFKNNPLPLKIGDFI